MSEQGLGIVIEAQRIYNWEFRHPDIANALGNYPTALCQSVRLGQYEITKTSEIRIAAFKKFFAGEMEIASVSATYLCQAPDYVAEYFQKWRNLIIDDRGCYGLPVVYKKDTGRIVLFNSAGNIVNSIKLMGLFPIGLPKLDLDYSREDVVKYEVEFKVDKVVLFS